MRNRVIRVGIPFFEDEHNAWERLNTELLAQGYSVEEVESLRKKI